MICSNCNTEFDDKSSFCPKCGAKVKIKISKIFLLSLGIITFVTTILLGGALTVNQFFSKGAVMELFADEADTEITDEYIDKLTDYIFGSGTYLTEPEKQDTWNPEATRVVLYRWMGGNELLLNIANVMRTESFYLQEIGILIGIGVLAVLMLWLDTRRISPALLLYGTMITIGMLGIIALVFVIGKDYGTDFIVNLIMNDIYVLIFGVVCVILGCILKKKI